MFMSPRYRCLPSAINQRRGRSDSSWKTPKPVGVGGFVEADGQSLPKQRYFHDVLVKKERPQVNESGGVFRLPELQTFGGFEFPVNIVGPDVYPEWMDCLMTDLQPEVRGNNTNSITSHSNPCESMERLKSQADGRSETREVFTGNGDGRDSIKTAKQVIDVSRVEEHEEPDEEEAEHHETVKDRQKFEIFVGGFDKDANSPAQWEASGDKLVPREYKPETEQPEVPATAVETEEPKPAVVNGKLFKDEAIDEKAKELSPSPARFPIGGFGLGGNRGNNFSIGYNSSPVGSYWVRMDNRYGPNSGGRGGYPTFSHVDYGSSATQASLNDEGVALSRWVQSVVREEWAAEVFDGLGMLDDDQGARRLEDEFAPSILAEKYMTAKDDEIHKIDVPDRFQLSEEITSSVPHNEKGLLSWMNMMDKSSEVSGLFFGIGHEPMTKFLGGQLELRIEALVDARDVRCQVLEDIAEELGDTPGVWYIWQDWSNANRFETQEEQKHLKRELLLVQDQIIENEMVQMQQIVDSDLAWRRLIRSVREQYLAKLKTFSLTAR